LLRASSSKPGSAAVREADAVDEETFDREQYMAGCESRSALFPALRYANQVVGRRGRK
jgi:hypothetical protein